MTAARPGNLANLRAAATRRHEAALTRADQGLDKVLRSGEQITFRAVARTAKVSLEFLYNHPELRSRIEHLRAQQQTTTTTPAHRASPAPAATDQPSNVIRTLTARLSDLTARHRSEITQLRQALEAAHGENLLLRRRLAHPATRPTPGDQSDTAATSTIPTDPMASPGPAGYPDR